MFMPLGQRGLILEKLFTLSAMLPIERAMTVN